MVPEIGNAGYLPGCAGICRIALRLRRDKARSHTPERRMSLDENGLW